MALPGLGIGSSWIAVGQDADMVIRAAARMTATEIIGEGCLGGMALLFGASLFTLPGVSVATVDGQL